MVVLGLGTHFTTFPPSIFVQRLAGSRATMAALLAWEPHTLVVIKLANTGYRVQHLLVHLPAKPAPLSCLC
ncbi:hypothetical protein CB1_000537007 [Camelus ferus]|nr:hypothetical protein CB1_000537007 [Camelus ferus]